MRILLVRHGETEWSASGKHTSTTDVGLTVAGRDAARRLGERLAGRAFALVHVSPRRRAQETCRLAGFAGERADRVIARAPAADGDVALFAHGHILRVVVARWLELPPQRAASFALDTATLSELGFERESRVVRLWNA